MNAITAAVEAITVATWLAQARTQGLDRLDAQLLLGHQLRRNRAWLIAHDDAVLSAEDLASLQGLLDQRLSGVPMAYLLGHKDFHGLELAVTPAVLVPRPDTEVLVDWALDVLSNPTNPTHPKVVDLGTGSGAIALAIRHRAPQAVMHASDVRADALSVAQGNGQRLNLPVEWRQGSWWSPWVGCRFDLALSNPPYIDGDDVHLAALHAEPTHALTPGPDGMANLRHIIEAAPPHLNRGAWLMLEHGYQQGEAVRSVLRHAGFSQVTTRRDLGGQERCTAGLWIG
jgi:release factor glutamine methyltransferase